MKNFIFVFLALLVATEAFAGGQQTLVNGNGVPLGTASNPLYVSGGGGAQAEDPSVIFNVKTEYGAKGDGVYLLDGAITATDKTFTSATASFTSADVGKVIHIFDAGGTDLGFTTTIASVTSSTEVELTDAAVATVSNAPYVYGTDDTADIQETIDAVGTNVGGIVYFPEGIYIVNGTFTQVDNSQLGLPTVAIANEGVSIEFRGARLTMSNGIQRGGSTIFSTRYGTNGSYSVMSGRKAGETGDLTNVRATFTDIRFTTVQNPTHTSIDLLDVNTANGRNLTIDTIATYSAYYGDVRVPTHTDSYGIKMPGTFNGNTSGGFHNLRVKTHYNGILFGEHSTGDNIMVVQSVYALVFDTCRYPVTLGQVNVEISINTMKFQTATSYVDIASLQVEHWGTGSTFEFVTDIEDASNYAIGNVTISTFSVASGTLFVRNTGGKYLTVKALEPTSGIRTKQRGNVSDLLYLQNSGTSSTTSGGGIILQQDGGAAVSSGHRLGSLSFSGAYNTSNGTNTGASVRAYAAEAFTTSSTGGTDIAFWNSPIGSATQAETMRLTSAGNLGLGNTSPAGRFVVSPPASEAIAGAATITANACGTIKQISSTGNVTTNTTDTFTAPAAANTGCCMDVINIDTADTITLDQNAKFLSAGGADVALGPNDTARVCSNGTSWFQVGATGNN